MGIFQYMGNWIDELFNFLKTSANTDVVQALATLVAVTIVIQIIVKAFQVSAGKSSAPTQELVWDISLKILIIGVAMNLSGFLDAIKLSMEELHKLMSGDKNLYSVLDEKLKATIELADVVYDEGNIFSGPFYALIIFASFLLGIVPSVFIVISTDVTLRLLLLIAPIIIFFRAYSWGKQMFDQWLSAFFTNLLVVFMVGTILNLFVEKYGKFIAHETEVAKKTTSLLTITGEVVLMSLLLFVLMKLVVTMAEKIGSVSIESAPKSAANLSDSARHNAQSYANMARSTGLSYAGSKSASGIRSGYNATSKAMQNVTGAKLPYGK